MTKLIKTERVRLYELTVLVKSDATEADTKAVSEEIEKHVSKHKGKVVETQDWGVKDLAYAFNKSRQAKFIHYVLEMPTKEAIDFEKEVYLMPAITRHLLIGAK